MLEPIRITVKDPVRTAL